LPLKKLLRWKLNNSTPIIVRCIIENSGFQLFSNELELESATDIVSSTKELEKSHLPREFITSIVQIMYTIFLLCTRIGIVLYKYT